MKNCSIIWAIILTFLSGFSCSLFKNVINNNENLIKIVIEQVKFMNSADYAIHDIKLLAMKHEEKTGKVDEIVENIRKSLPIENLVTVVTPRDLTFAYNQKIFHKFDANRFRHPSMVIIVCDASPNELAYLENLKFAKTQVRLMFISLLNNGDERYLRFIARGLKATSKLNSIIIDYDQDNDVARVYNFNIYDTKSTKLNAIEKVEQENLMNPRRLENFNQSIMVIKYINEFPIVHEKKENTRVLRGTAISLLKSYAKKFNVKLMSEKIRFDKKIQIGTNHIFLNNVKLSEKDMARVRFQMINTFQTERTLILLPKPQPKPVVAFLLYIFDWRMMTWTLASLMILSMLWKFMNWHRNEDSTAGSFLVAFLCFFIGQSSGITTRSLLKNIFLILMTMLAFLLGNLYQGEIASSLTLKMASEPKITTVKGVIQSDFTFYTAGLDSGKLIRGINPSLQKKCVGTVEAATEYNFKKFSEEKRGIIMNSGDYYQIMTNEYFVRKLGLDPTIEKYYYKVEEELAIYPKHFSVLSQFPFRETLERFNLEFFETGLHQVEWNVFHYKDKKTENKPEFLTLDDLEKVFMIIPIGLTLAAITFVIECLVHYKLKRSVTNENQMDVKLIRVESEDEDSHVKIPIVHSTSGRIAAFIEIKIENDLEFDDPLEIKYVKEFDENGEEIDGSSVLDGRHLICVAKSSGIYGFILVDSDDENDENSDEEEEQEQVEAHNPQGSALKLVNEGDLIVEDLEDVEF